MKYFKLFLFVFLLFISLMTYAQDKSIDTVIKTYKFPFDIKITANRINTPLKDLPISLSIISAKELENTLNKKIAPDEALKLVPGVKIDNQADGNRVHLSIRGQGILSERGIRGVKTLLDNIPLNDASGFTPDMYDVDWSTIKSIEILRGPSASIFGASSSGGIINIITQDGYNKPLGGEVDASYGTYNFWKLLGQFGGMSGDVDYRVSASRFMGDGYRVHTAYWGNNVYGKLNYSPALNIKFTPVINYSETYSENAEGLNLSQYNADPEQPNPDAVPKNEYLYTQRFTAGLSGIFDINKNNGISFYGFAKRTYFKESVPSSVLNREFFIPGGSLQYNLKFESPAIKHNISIGADFQSQTVEDSRYANLGGGIEDKSAYLARQSIFQSGTGAFLMYRLGLKDKWSFLINGRYDYVHNKLEDKIKNPRDLSDTKNFERFTAKAGITYTPAPGINIFADFGQGFIPPSIEELANNPKPLIFGGFNQDLTFAKSDGVEAGIRGDAFKNILSYEATLFYLNTKNDFNRFRIPGRPLETFYRNTDSLGNSLGSNRLGAEIFLKYMPVKNLTFQIAYTFSDFKYNVDIPERIIMDDTSIYKYIEDGNYLPNSPEHQAYIDLQYNFLPELYVGASAEVYSRSYIDGANILAESVPGFVLYNARAGYSFNLYGYKLEASLFVKNVFSRKWVAFTEPDPGGNSYQPGAPVEIFGNLRFIFK